ncbi:MAG TPA: PTS sugar transporter subunit IIA [Candidatus Bathyarchaeia archaeon]|nr:PTS sugar transporter subunit IIA [Candidatus Bathyarchaeia archaeon]
MRQFVFASHGLFADGIRHALELIVGKRTNISTICAYVEQGVELKSQIREVLERTAPHELIVITDLFGGSVNNEFMNLLTDNPRIYLIAGLNLPLLIDLVTMSDAQENTETLIADALKNAKASMQYCNLTIQKNKTEDEDF